MSTSVVGRQTSSGPPTVVLVHGAWHGAWCWQRVIEELAASGTAALAVQLPYTSFDDDVATARDVVSSLVTPVVLVGHSLGGGVVCAVAEEPNVRYLGFVSAMVVDPGQTLAERFEEHDVPVEYRTGSTPELVQGIRPQADGTIAFDPAVAPSIFFSDCTAADVAQAVPRLRPASASSMSGVPVSGHAHVPSSFVFCTEDRALPREVQLAFAASLTGPHAELDCSHSPFLSRPEELADIVAGWAASVR